MKYFPRKPKITVKDQLTKKVLQRLYIKEHFSMQQIADHFHCSRAYLSKLIKEYKLKTEKAINFKFSCDFCGEENKIIRSKWVKSRKHFCNKDCYIEFRTENKFNPKRHIKKVSELFY